MPGVGFGQPEHNSPQAEPMSLRSPWANKMPGIDQELETGRGGRGEKVRERKKERERKGEKVRERERWIERDGQRREKLNGPWERYREVCLGRLTEEITVESKRVQYGPEQ